MAGHTVLILLSVLVWLSVSIAVAVDAIRRGRIGGVWGIVVFLLGPIGLVIYVLVILSASASTVEDADQPIRICSNCGDRSLGAVDRCESCGERLGPEDEPPSAGILQSGARSYCSNCYTRVEPDTTMCPGCGSVL